MPNRTIQKGDEIMIFYQGKSIAFATSHTLSLSTNMVDIASKDHGDYGASYPGKRTWEIQTSNLYTEDQVDLLFGLWQNGTQVDIIWGKASDYTSAGIADGLSEDDASSYAAPTTNYLTGKAIISSLNLTAQTGENATFDATFTGVGKIEKKTA